MQRDAYLGRRAPINRSDGLLIISLAPLDDEAEGLIAAGAPVVLVDASIRGCRAWSPTKAHGGELATRHLLELGHKRIATVGD